MKVGDLVECRGYVALVVVHNDFETLIRWLDDGPTINLTQWATRAADRSGGGGGMQAEA